MHTYTNCNNWMRFIWFWFHFCYDPSAQICQHRKERQVCITAHLSIYDFQMSTSASTMLHISCIFHQIFMQYRHANDMKRTEESRVPTISLYVAGHKKRLLVDGLTIYRVIYSHSFYLTSHARVFYLYIVEYFSPSLFLHIYVYIFFFKSMSN